MARARAFAGWAVLLVVILSLPIWVGSNFLLYLATQAGVYMIVAFALNFLAGYAGQVSLGHGALVGIGAYATAILMINAKLSFFLAAPLAMIITSGAGALMALPAFRLSTWYFALITLTFAQVVGELLVEWRGLTRGFDGIIGIPPPAIFGHNLPLSGIYILVALAVMVQFVLIKNLVWSRIGRAMVATRDNPHSAVASGVSIVRLKMFAFVVSASMAGLGGAFYAVQKTVLTTEDFSADFSIFFLLIVVVGGSGRLWGPVAGTLVFFLVPELLGALHSWRILVYGVALLALMLFAPQGIVGQIENVWRQRRPATRLNDQGRVQPFHVEGTELAIEGVTKRFGGVLALNDASFKASGGLVHAIVGPNGSGKTTLLNLISGYYEADSGEIRLGETKLRGITPHQIARLGVGRTFQTPKLLNHETVLDNVLLGTFARENATSLEVALRLPRARAEARMLRDEALHYLNFVGLSEKAMNLAGEVPHGQQRLLEIARVLAAHPKVMLLDEPAAGLSLSELDRLSQLIRDIAAHGTTVVIVEHHLELVADICKSVTVLDRGRVLTAGSPAEAFSNPAVIAAYVGRTAIGNPA
jgi:ABC-type branched-subunit amino acid transport system ATPase component/ABC-type branched-subunit amino acid transport system permease subunit